MWEFGVITLKEKRAYSCGYSTIKGKFRLHSECIEVCGVSNTVKNIEATIPVTVIKKIEFD